ncbi:MAG: response regulator [Gammaproteobacteria bacterium]|nr:response regulator [Gammaproteobacteria bacterium]
MSKIMIIDDDRDIIDSISMILEANDFTVVSKMDTNNLITEIESENPDLILLDIVFPEDAQAGFKAARKIASEETIKKIPILVLSAVNQLNNLGFSFTENDISNDFMPVNGFIEKPVKPDVLLEKIKSLGIS